MNILIGICGIGYGHSNRQSIIIKLLESLGAKIAITGFGCSQDYLKKNFPHLPFLKVVVPWVFSNKDGIDYKKTSGINKELNIFHRNFLVYEKIDKIFKGKLDLVISDYEPVSASFSYASNTRLITLDQQSKFMGFEFPSINGLSRNEELYRLSYFFPKANRRISMSFYKVNYQKDSNYLVEIIPAKIREEIMNIKRKNIEKNTITVYLSPHSSISQNIREILSILQNFKSIKFNVFLPSIYKINSESNWNISFYNYSQEKFLESIKKSFAVISTAGHTLLSELMFLKIPVIVIPLKTYDQNYCAKFIEENNLGLSCQYLSKYIIERFLDNYTNYQTNVNMQNGLYNLNMREKELENILFEKLFSYE